ncbi:glycoside hydrolase family 9 protein [Clostridium cellulovorans]|uniref:Glucanase n=1 Tax=Clostridium cellulovorans (strain ATCC 35296 / DSM 3052 / OCM 3 / 743B) TaxID=573061 RepID=D9SS70_CLOC7|nr:glycoside hydrolase family 9 protein [Clostridium cellulovorans]ADL52517.1 glycoside hydrolase family 9 [Clostridium cellulovorans 743B]
MRSKKLIACVTALATVLSVSTVATSVATTKTVSAATMVSVGELIRNNKFDNGVGLPWTVVESYPAKSSFEIKDGKYYVTVLQDGVEGRWDVQFRHRGLVIEQGHKYRVKFTVTADKDCYVYPKIGDQGEPYKEYWNYNSYQRVQLRAGVPTTIDQTFEMRDATARTAEFAIHLAGDCKAATFPYTFTFDDMYVSDPQFPGYVAETPEPTNAIRVNQVGYLPGVAKKATVVTKATTPINWYLKNSSGVQVATGTTTVKGLDSASGDNVHIIDFSNYTTPGTGYTLSVDSTNVDSTINDSASSMPFTIGTDLYSKMKHESIKYFYLNRSAIPITMPYAERTDLTRAAGHTTDLMPTDASSSDPSPWYKENYSLDVTGGWYDAGDHGKYVVNGGISVWTMMNQYERAKKLGQANVAPFADNTMNIPESGNGYPDILDESRFQMDLMMKMQIPAGKTYAGMAHHKGHDERWTALAIRPDQDPMKRYLKAPSTAATLNLAATAAQASRLWKGIDDAYSAKCLASAETAWKAAKANPAIYAPFENGPGGGAYGDDNVTDEFYWAAAELYETTGTSEYLDYMKNNSSDKFLKMPTTLTGGEDKGLSGAFDWGNVAGLGTISLAIGDKLDATSKATVRANVAAAADVFVANTNSEGYGTPMVQGPAFEEKDASGKVIRTITGYPWGSNSFVANQAIVMGYAYDFTKGDADKKKSNSYFNGLTSAMDYLLGRNPMVQSYVTGYGSNPLENPHHRFWAYQADNTFPKAPAGCLSGGPNTGLQDPWVKGSGWGVGTKPAAKCFMDNIESWSTNEITINWNAPIAWMSSYMDLNKDAKTIDITIPPTTSGDVNGDTKINAIDLAMLKKYILDNSTVIKTANADMNNDGKINAIDLALLKKKLLS